MKNIFFVQLFLIFFLTSCVNFEKAGKVLRNEKTKTTDEFLVKKRKPLILPPDYDKLPSPKSETVDEKSSESEKIKKILKSNNQIKNKTGSSSTEKSIIDRIRK